MRIELAYLTAERQFLLELDVEDGTRASELVQRACESGELPPEVTTLPVGIWGRVVEQSRPLQEGDRVEIYRPLMLDPREARRRYAEAGGTMSGKQADPVD